MSSTKPPAKNDVEVVEVSEVTKLLNEIRVGDRSAQEKLLPLIYQELHRLASFYMKKERPDHTLQPTALINEAYLRLTRENVDWKGRAHFVGVAALTMRRVLVDHARAHRAGIRSGGLERTELVEGLAISLNRTEEILQLDEALERLARKNERQARVVELRYFGGLSIEETASSLGIAPRSVKRDWSIARLWLFKELRPL